MKSRNLFSCFFFNFFYLCEENSGEMGQSDTKILHSQPPTSMPYGGAFPSPQLQSFGVPGQKAQYQADGDSDSDGSIHSNILLVGT